MSSNTYEKLSSNKAKLSFVVGADEFAEAVQNAYVKGRKKISIPGFRKGKAPRKVIETYYGSDIFYDDALNDMFPDMYQAALDEHGLKPVDRPEFDLDKIEPGKDVTFRVEVFVRPDVKLGEYKGLKVEAFRDPVTDDMVAERIKQDQEKVSRAVDVEDRPAAESDHVIIDYEGTVDGKPFEGGKAEGSELDIGSHRFIPGFEEQIIGMNHGEEKDIEVTFPDDYFEKKLQGKKAVFHIKLKTIQKTEIPELDDDFAADVSDFNTLDEYRANIRKELEEQAEENFKNEKQTVVLKKAMENAEIDIPKAMIEEELNYLMQQVRYRMAYSGVNMEDYLKYTGTTLQKFRENYRAQAEAEVRKDLVVDAIVKTENIEVTDDELNKEIEKYAKEAGKTDEEYRKTLNDDMLANIREYLKREKVPEMLVSNAEITEKVREPKKAEDKPKETK